MEKQFHISEVHEREIGIEFDDDPRVVDAPMEALQRKLDEAAVQLGAEERGIERPVRGFLRNPLSPEQKRFINTMLTLRISANNVLQQEGLKDVPIDERREKMKSLASVFKEQDIDVSYTRTRFHEACAESAGKERIWYMRESAAYNLARVFRVLNKLDIRPHLEDCFRPPEVQHGLLLRRIVDVALQNPDWSPENVFMASKSFTASVSGLAGHQAGAAIDVRFKSMQTDALFDLGNEYPEGSAVACINSPYVTGDQFVARMQFAHIMRMGGFKILDTENWHASHGDRGLSLDSHAPAMKAIYGPIRSFDPKTGEVRPWEDGKADIPFLADEDAYNLVSLARVNIEKDSPLGIIDRHRVLMNHKSFRRLQV